VAVLDIMASPRRWAVLLVLLFGASIAACGAPSRSEAQGGDAELLEEVRRYEDLVNTFADNESSAREAIRLQQEFARECMEHRGFEFVSGDLPPADPNGMKFNSVRYLLFDVTVDDASAGGFGIWDWLDLRYNQSERFVQPFPTPDLDGDPSSMSAAEWAYERNLHGYGTDETVDPETAQMVGVTGCLQLASAAHPSSPFEVIDMERLHEGLDLYLSHPDVIERMKEWTRCLAGVGYPGYPLDPSVFAAEEYLRSLFPEDVHADPEQWRAFRAAELRLTADYVRCLDPHRADLERVWTQLFDAT
jgi:hypothetical protein